MNIKTVKKCFKKPDLLKFRHDSERSFFSYNVKTVFTIYYKADFGGQCQKLDVLKPSKHDGIFCSFSEIN